MTPEHTPDIDDYLKWLEQSPEVLKHAPDAVAIYDLDGCIVYGNTTSKKLMGAQFAGRLIDRQFTAHLTPEAAANAARDFANCITLGDTIDSETIFRDGDGQPVPVMIRLVPARFGGTIVGVVGFARDTQQFRSLFENHPDALALHDLDGRFTRVNEACERLTGYSAAELLGQAPALLTPGGWDEGARIRDAIARGESIEFESIITTRDGGQREIDGRAVPLHVDGRVRGWCGMIRDVTEERRLARMSARQATRIAELYRIAASASVSTGEKIATALEAGMLELNSAWACVQRAATAGEPAAITYSVGKNVPASLEHGAAGIYASAPLTVDGKPYGEIAFALGAEGVTVAAMDRDYLRALAALIGSAIQQNDREKRLDTLAFGDSLTGLPNRALLEDRLEQTLLSARRHRRSFASHYIDIDHFKEINDTYGHQFGDAVLVAVAGWLRTMLRDSDTIGRIGGDEFVVLQPEIDSQSQAEELAAKLCGIRDKTFTIGEREIVVTISVGCALFPVDAENPIDMLRAADSALYDVKHRGRNGYAIGTF
jgi:diguanylate cyclase (GGDEF)-like protein/PAS domain S-box-containing protein